MAVPIHKAFILSVMDRIVYIQNSEIEALSLNVTVFGDRAFKEVIKVKCSWTNKWIKKMWYIDTMEYYSAIRKNGIMPFAATWMDLEITILSEVSQTEKDKYHMISLICGV